MFVMRLDLCLINVDSQTKRASKLAVIAFLANQPATLFFVLLFYVSAHYTTAVNIGILQGAIPIIVLIGAFFLYGALH